jgi:hypothetical protein
LHHEPRSQPPGPVTWDTKHHFAPWDTQPATWTSYMRYQTSLCTISLRLSGPTVGPRVPLELTEPVDLADRNANCNTDFPFLCTERWL